MKIAQITYSGFGGLGSVVFSIISADKTHEHHWHVGFIGDQPIDGSYTTLCAKHNVDFASFQFTPGRPYRAWLKLAKWLATIKPDVVICHSINSILACRWYASKYGALTIAVEHTANQVKSRRMWAVSKVSMLVADQVVILTNEYRDELLKELGSLFREKKVRVIPNGIDTSMFSPSETISCNKGKRIRLGMAARFSFSKRQDLLIQVMTTLTEQRPDLFFELHLAGDGNELDRVMAIANSSPTVQQIHFNGLLSEEEISAWMRDLDIYVHATDGETLSTSLLQAMATGLPIIASEIPGVSNLLNGSEIYGHCVPNKPEAFANAILHLIDNPLISNELGLRARSHAEKNYSNEAMLRAYLKIVEDLH